MTEENIKRMALEAGFSDGEVDYIQSIIIHFATLVAQQERERIAKEIEKMTVFGKDTISSFTVVIRNMQWTHLEKSSFVLAVRVLEFKKISLLAKRIEVQHGQEKYFNVT